MIDLLKREREVVILIGCIALCWATGTAIGVLLCVLALRIAR